MSWRGVSLLCLVSGWIGCSASPPGPAADPANGAGVSSQGTQSGQARVVGEATDRGDGQASATESGALREGAGREGEGRLRLVLPRLEAFVNAELPAERPDRYASFREVSRIQVGQSHLQQVDLFPNERFLLAVSDAEATVRIYDRETQRLVGNHRVPGFAQWTTGGVVAWPEGELTFLAGSRAGLSAFDGRTGEELSRLDPRPVRSLRWAPDRRVLVAEAAVEEPNDPSSLYFFERGEGLSLRALGALRFAQRIDAWDLSADNRLLAILDFPSNALVVLDLHEGNEVLRVPAPRYSGDVAFSPDGRWVAVGGQGLLLVDLLAPERRGFYSHVYNNIGFVRFSPSGDALVASSYDGHLRIFRYEEPAEGGGAARLRLEQVLRHQGQANVYGFVFEGGGDGLVSASGDQTVRTFRGRSASAKTEPRSSRKFLSLAEWRKQAGGESPSVPVDTLSVEERARHPGPRPSRIQPGEYACRITTAYRMRDCWVRKDAQGHTVLTFASDNLLALEGILYDDGPVVRLDGWLNEPSTVVGCADCQKQPLRAVLRGTGKNWQGLLLFRNYYLPAEPPELPPANVRIEEANDRFPLELQLRRAYPEGSGGVAPR